MGIEGVCCSHSHRNLLVLSYTITGGFLLGEGGVHSTPHSHLVSFKGTGFIPFLIPHRSQQPSRRVLGGAQVAVDPRGKRFVLGRGTGHWAR